MRTASAAPRSRRGSPISAPIRPLPAPPPSCTASASMRRRRTGRARPSRAAGGCGSRSPPCCSPSPTCCSSTSRPTISTSKARSGSTTISRATRTPSLIISHDRDLLDTCVDHILHLDRGKLTLYRGGYTSFARQLAEKRELTAKMQVKQEAERKHLQAFVDRFRAKASKARQAQSRIKRLAKLEPVTALVEEETLAFDLPSPERPLAPPLVALEGRRGRLRRPHGARSAQPHDPARRPHRAPRRQRQRQVDLLQAHRRRLAPLKGEMRRSAKMDVAYFAQHQLDELNPAATAYDHVAARMPGEPVARIRARAARFGFPGREGRDAGLGPVGRREGAAAHGARRLQRPAPPHPRRADEPPRHRQPHRPHGGDQRL